MPAGSNVPAVLTAKVSAFVKNNPEVAVFVAGDRTASYDTVYQAMVLLQQAGVDFDRTADIDPGEFLPKWLHPRKAA